MAYHDKRDIHGLAINASMRYGKEAPLRWQNRMNEKKECMDFIEALGQAASPKEICRLRTQYCLEWYTRKAIKYKYIFLILSIVNIAIPQISTIVIIEGECILASAVMSAIVSFSAALLALLNVRERWTAYRSAAENIKRQYTLYCLQTSPYQGEEAHLRYLQVLEQGMAEEHKHWVGLQKKDYADLHVEAGRE